MGWVFGRGFDSRQLHLLKAGRVPAAEFVSDLSAPLAAHRYGAVFSSQEET